MRLVDDEAPMEPPVVEEPELPAAPKPQASPPPPPEPPAMPQPPEEEPSQVEIVSTSTMLD